MRAIARAATATLARRRALVSPGPYLLAAAGLAAIALLVGYSALSARRLLLPGWTGAPARLVESVVFTALLIWICEVLGAVGLFYGPALVAAAALVAAVCATWARSSALSRPAKAPPEDSSDGHWRNHVPTGETAWSLLVMAAVVGTVVAHWAITTKRALDHGISNFDSLWYHLPFAADMVQSHSLTGLHYTETVFTNWLYPQNAEVLHAVGMLITGRDTLSLFVNFGWLGLAFLAAWCIGAAYGRGSLTVIAVAVLLECHTVVVREPGAAKNDLAPAALLLAAVAILIQVWARHGRSARSGSISVPPPGWPLAVAGLATGLAVGTRYTAVAMAAGLTVAVLALAPSGRRLAAAGWWTLPAVLGGGYWYVRNAIVAGNPLPEIEGLGPVSLPHPLRLQTARPDFTVAHYATDTAVWREYFVPGLHQAFGALWPVVLACALGGAVLAVLRGRDRIVRWIGAVALLGMVAYLFTPLTAAGAEGAPSGFAINVRYVIPALIVGIALLPLDRALSTPARRLWLAAALALLLLLTDRPDAIAHDPGRLLAAGFVVLAVLVPAGLLLLAARGRLTLALAGFAVLALVIAGIGYPLQRHYLRSRFANSGPPDTRIPGMDLDSAYRWARNVENARIGLVGTTAGFSGYGFFGTDLSNEVRYLGQRGPHAAHNAIPTCEGFRSAVNAADLDYLVTSPFLNFLHPSAPIRSPEARWLRGETAVAPILRSGPVTVWRVHGTLDPKACGHLNAPLREVPDAPDQA